MCCSDQLNPPSKADVTSLESDVCVTPESRHHPTQPLLHLIFHWMGQGFFVLKHRAKIAHVEISAARFAFSKSVQLRAARWPVSILGA